MSEFGAGRARSFHKRVARAVTPWVLSIAIVATATALIYSTPSHVSSQDGWVRIVGMLDHWHYYVPMGFYLDSRLHDGEIPLWNPLILCGTPFAASISSFLCYPFNFVRSCLTFDPTPMKTHLGVAILLGAHILLAGVGTFFLARRHGMSQGAACVAALAFLCSASFVRRAYAEMFITTIAWVPVILILLRLAFEQTSFRRKLYYATATGLVFGVSVLSGSPHMTLLTSFLIALYGVCFRFFHLRMADLHAPGALTRVVVGDFIAGVLIFVLAAGIAWVMLYPAFELSAMTPRGSAENIAASGWRGFSWLRGYLVFYSGATSKDTEYGLAGLGVTLLALAALGHWRKRDVLIFVFVLLFFLDCAHGPPLPCSRLMLWIAPYKLNDMRRALLFAALAIGFLAGFGTDAVASRWQSRRPSIVLSLLFAALGPWLIWLLYQGTNPYVLFSLPKTAVILPGVVLAAILLAGWLPWPLRIIARDPRDVIFMRRRGFVYGLVAWSMVMLTFGEQYVWGVRYVERLFNWRGFKGTAAALIQGHEMTPDNRRGVDKAANKAMNELLPMMNGYDPAYIERTHAVLTSAPRYNAYVRPRQTITENLRGHLLLKRLFWLARQYVRGPLPDKDTPFPAATTVFLKDAPADLPMPSVAAPRLRRSCVSADTLEVFRAGAGDLAPKQGGLFFGKKYQVKLPAVDMPPLHGALVLEYTSDCSAKLIPRFYDPSAKSSQEGKNYRIRPTLSAAQTIEIPLPDLERFSTTLAIEITDAKRNLVFTRARILCDQEDENEHIRLLTYKANEVEVEVSGLTENRILTYLDSFYPGWHAYVDGKEVPIYLADDAFKAVLVPQGTHRIRFAFRPQRVYAGMAVSAGAVVFSVLVLVLARGRKPATPAPILLPSSGQEPRKDAASSEVPEEPTASANVSPTAEPGG